MAGTPQRPGEELESIPAPKKFKRSETSEELPVEEYLTESIAIPSTSKSASQAELTLEQKGTKESPGIAGSAGTSIKSKEQLGLQGSPQFLEQEEDIATEEVPSTSQESQQLGTLRPITVSYRNPDDHPASAEIAVSDASACGASQQGNAAYEDLSLIGNGAYGTVYKAKDKGGQDVALKRVRIPLSREGLPTSTLREISILKELDTFEHPNIVRLIDVCQGESLYLPTEEQSERPNGLVLWLVFEHVERDLASYIDSYRKRSPRLIIPPCKVRQMTQELLKGVDFLHSHRVLHRDLKPQNLLVTRDGTIKIADFGLAKTYDFEMRLTSLVVTQWYRAPEVLLGCSYATPVDIWSVGCIFAELCKLEPLFPGTSEGDQLDRIFQVLGTPSQDAWPENVSLSWTAFPHRQPKHFGAIIPDLDEDGLDLIKGMLMFDPHSRLTAAQALRHRYFKDSYQ